MNRRAALRLLAGGACLATSTGCLHDRGCSLDKWLGQDNKPKPPKFSAASLQVAQRVEELGRRIIAQNAFTGIDPLFHTVGVPESVLFHRGTSELFVSEGLVKKCKTDGELAAVLCSELAAIMAEKRIATGVGQGGDSIVEVGPKDGVFTGTANGAEVVGKLEQPGSEPRAVPPPDVAATAKQLLTGAGFDTAELESVEPLLKQSDRGDAIRKQMAGSAPAPTWQK